MAPARVMQVYSLLLLSLASACSPADPSSGLFVQASADPVGADGSDCLPFPSLAAALQALPITGGTLLPQPMVDYWPLGGLVIELPSTIDGQGGKFLLNTSTEISSAGYLVLRNLVLSSDSEASFEVKGQLSLQSCTLRSLQGDFARVSGWMEVVSSRTESSTGTLASLSTFGTTLLLLNSDFSDLSAVLAFQPTALSPSPNFPSSILVQNCSISQFKTAIMLRDDVTMFSGTYTGVSELTVRKCTFESFTEVAIQGDLYFWNVTITESSFSWGKTALQLRLNDHSHVVSFTYFRNLEQGANLTALAEVLTFTSCSFSHTSQSVILTQARPFSLLSLSSCSFQDIGNSTSTGSVLLLQNAGKVMLVDSQVRNSQAKNGGIVYGALTTLIELTDCSFTNLTAVNGPVVDLQSSALKILRTHIDKTKTMGNALNIVGQTTALTDSTFRNIQSGSYLFYIFESVTQVTGCLVESCGAGNQMMTAATSTVPCFVSNTVFRNVSFGNAFVLPYASQMYYYNDVTFDMAKEVNSGTLFANFGTLIAVTKGVFSGSVGVLAGGVGPVGYTSLVDCVFANLTLKSLFAAGTATLLVANSTFTDVVVTNAKAFPLRATLLTFTNNTIARLQGSFIDIKQSTLLITGLTVRNSSVLEATNFLDTIQSVVTMKNAVFQSITLRENSALFKFDLQSLVTISSSTFANLSVASATGLIIAKHSSLQLSSLTAAHFTTSFVVAAESSLTMSDSTFLQIGEAEAAQYDGGAVHGVQMLSVNLTNCSFTQVQARKGGALYVAYTNPNKPSIRRQMSSDGFVRVTECRFEYCRSAEDGGSVYLSYATATFSEVVFEKNTAAGSGGALALYCDPTELQFACFYRLHLTTFLSNSALSGGALKYDKVKPLITNSSEHNNTALYGHFWAAFPVELRHMHATTLHGQSGVPFSDPITLGLYDELGQLVVSDGISKGFLRATVQTALVSGLQTVQAQQGVFTFAGLSIVDTPGKQISLQLTSDAIDYAHPNPNTGLESQAVHLDLVLRTCIAGEIISNSVCDLCAAGTYSFNTSDTVCSSCPTGLTCHGGANTTVSRNYWRPTNTSELLLDCYAQDICLGGNLAQCETGYTGRLCTFCDESYFRFGNFFCLPCGNSVWGVFRGVLVILGTALFLVVMIIGNLRSTVKKKSSLSPHFRILLNFNQVSMLMSSLQIKWPVDLLSFFEGLKLTGNATQFAFSNECLAEGSTINYLYQKVVLVAVIPLIMILIAVIIWGPVALIKRNTEYLRVHAICSVIVLLLSMQPIVLQSSLQVYPCVEVEPGSLWLLHDMRIACWQGDHSAYALGVALPAILVWCVATPLLFWALLYRQRRNLNNPVNIRRIGFLYSGYHPRFYFWEFVVVLRKSVMVIIANLMVTVQNKAQCLVALSALWLFLVLQYKATPFETHRFNRTEFLSLLSSLVTVVAGSLYLSDLRAKTGAYYALLVLVFAFNLLFMLVWIVLFCIYLAQGASARVAHFGKWLDKVSEKYLRG